MVHIGDAGGLVRLLYTDEIKQALSEYFTADEIAATICLHLIQFRSRIIPRTDVWTVASSGLTAIRAWLDRLSNESDKIISRSLLVLEGFKSF